MCAHGMENIECPLCDSPPEFTASQVAFLEDLLINKGCMQALANGVGSTHPEKCRECALRIEDLVRTIRMMSAGGGRSN